MKQFTDYFDESFSELMPKVTTLESLIGDQEEMVLVSGDFWGIQHFIFDGLTTKNAAKVLRAKSAFVQIYMQMLAQYICAKLNIDEARILTTNAGKLEILAPSGSEDVIGGVQKEIDAFFIEHFYGMSGVGLVCVPCSSDDFVDVSSYRSLRDRVAAEVEHGKYEKFTLVDQPAVLAYDSDINNRTLCPVCNIRKTEEGKEHCGICGVFIDLGRKLTKKEPQKVTSESLKIPFDSFSASVMLNERIKSYIPSHDGIPLTFEEIAAHSCQECRDKEGKETGVKALGILKADVDDMGKYLKNSTVIDSFENFDLFSKGLDAFFSLYVTRRLREAYRDIYTVFAGGDDLFLVGAWDQIMAFAREIEHTFKTFSKGRLTLSMGIAVAKPATPISYLADHTEKLLEQSKAYEGKDALSMWNMTAKWESYLAVYKELEKEFSGFDAVNTALLYRLLKLCDMSAHVREDIRNSMWRSKLNYLFSRNVEERHHYLLEILGRHIEKYPAETKMFLSEFIYKRRD